METAEVVIMRNLTKIMLAIALLVTAFAATAETSQFNVEEAGATFTVNKVDYRSRIIYAEDYEFSYNAATKFLTTTGEVKPSAVKKGSQIRFSISDKKLVSLRPILKEVRIRTVK